MLVRLISLLAAAWLVAQSGSDIDLQRMVAAERGFAAATKELGVRDGFLTFFTDDAIDVGPGPAGLALVKVKDRLRSQPPPRLPLITELTWEPRWGAISTAGDLGWLTGPYRIHSTQGTDADRHGAYFSIWRRQADRTYKVRLDIGIATARPVVFPDGFTAGPAPVARVTAPSVPVDELEIMTVEARFAEAAVKDVGAAYRAHLLPAARIHRNERSPFAGAENAAAFMASSFERIAWAVLHSETAASGDLAFTVGSYDAAAKSSEGRPGSHERGFFVRVWHRDAAGAWKIAFETNGIR